MPSLSLDDKAARQLGFLMGFANPRIVAALNVCGFDRPEHQRGWDLLRAVVGEAFDYVGAPPTDPKAVEAVDDWENRWYPIVDASLEHRFPEVHGRVFLNLSQTSGPEVLLSVATFVERIRGLGADGASDDDRAAGELLAKRGLDSA